MSGYRKLSRTASQRKALLRSQVTALLYHGRIITTEAKAKETQKIVEGLIALAVKEKDDYETVKVMAKVPRKDKDGKRVKEVIDGKKKTVYDEGPQPWKKVSRGSTCEASGTRTRTSHRRRRIRICFIFSWSELKQ